MAIEADSLARLALPSDGHRPQMPADGLTQDELAKTNGALEHLINMGHFASVNDNDALRKVPHPSNEGLPLQARVKGS